jgi:hypothetical protein
MSKHVKGPRLNDPLNESNWMAWWERMKRVLRLCGVNVYAEGTVEIPTDAKGVEDWEYNDNYAQIMIINNVTSTEMVHVSQCNTAKAMWDSLEAVHETKGHQTTVSIIRNLFHTKAEEDSNIIEHLNQLKQYWDRIIQMDDGDFRISNTLFKIIISSSLQLSWDMFTESYVCGRKGVTETDPKKLMGSQQFIGILKEKYLQRQLRAEKGEVVNQAFIPKRSLQNRINLKSNTNSDKSCKHCGRNIITLQNANILERASVRYVENLAIPTKNVGIVIKANRNVLRNLRRTKAKNTKEGRK